MTQRLPIASAVYIVATGDCGGGAVQKKKKKATQASDRTFKN